MHFLIDYTKTIIPSKWNQTQKGWYSGNCPVCIHNGQPRNDTRGRGGFIFDGDGFGYHCFNCHFSAKWEPGLRMTDKLRTLYECFGVSESEIHRLTIDLMREDVAEELILTTRAHEQKSAHVFIPTWDEIELPKNTTVLTAVENKTEVWQSVYDYVISRHINPNTVLYSPSMYPALMNQRFIVPYIHKGKIVGYNARFAGNDFDKEKISKYYKQSPDDFVFNLDNQSSKSKYVIVTEGEIDAMMVNGVSIGSNELSDNQAYLINKLNKQVILVPDFSKTGKVLVDAALNQNWMVSFPPWGEEVEDINDAVRKYGKLFVMKTIIDFASANAVKSRVMMNQLCR